jgi:hypothetical protein
MSRRTSVIILVSGVLLTVAVRGGPPFLSVRTTGVILMITGLAGLWPHGGRTWLAQARAGLADARARLRRLLDETAPVQGVRVPLDELLTAARRCADVWPPVGGHGIRRGAALPEVSRDGRDGESAQAYPGQRPGGL